MFSNYYEIEKMMQIRTKELLCESERDRLLQMIKIRKKSRRVKKYPRI